MKLKRHLPPGIPYEATIRKHLGRWELCLNYWRPPDSAEVKTHAAGAADVGIQPLAVDSELSHYPNPKPLYQYLKQLARWQKMQARRQKGSGGWHEAQDRLNSIWRKILGLRKDLHHQLSRLLVRKYQVLCIESLNVAGMDKLRFQAKAIRDAAIRELLRQIRYEADRYGTRIVEADRWYPSSKTCPACGVVNPELGREPKRSCPSCGVIHDRNQNAARNLRKLALLAVGEEVMRQDREAPAGDPVVACETAPNEERTKPGTTEGSQLTLAL